MAKLDDILDSLYYVTDPEVEHIPLEKLLGKVRAPDTGATTFSILR